MSTEQERAELLPCPFCGAGTTEIQENGRPWLGTRWGDPVSVSVRHWCEPVDGQPSRMIERVGRDRAAAIDAWNRRAALQSSEIQALMQRVEDLEKIVAECRDAMPIPNVGSKAEEYWPDAMSDAGFVPDFIKASVEALEAAIDHAYRNERGS